MEKKNYYDTDYEIDLVYVFKKLLRQWKIILIVGVITAIALLAGKYALDMRQYQQELSEAEKLAPTETTETGYTEEEMAEMRASLTVEEQANLQAAELAEQQLLILQEYMENSISYNSDAYNRPVVSLHYYIDTTNNVYSDEEERSIHTASFVQGYSNYILAADLSTKVVEKLGIDMKPQYITELLSVGGNGLTQAGMVVFVYGQDEAQAQDIADCVTESLEEYSAVLKDKMGQHDLVLVGSFTNVVMDSGLLTSQNQLQDKEIALNKELFSLKKEFSEIQTSLFNVTTTEAIGTPERPVIVKPSFDMKYLLLGFVLGAMFVAAAVAVPVLFSGKIDTTDTLEQTYGLHLLGNLSQGKNADERFAYALANIKLACEKAETQKILLLSTLELKDEEQTELKHLLNGLKTAGIEVVLETDVHNNADALQVMLEVDHVVLVEKTEVTMRKALEKELTLCDAQKEQVLGVIAI